MRLPLPTRIPRLHLPRGHRRRSALVAVVCALVVALVAASVFSIGYRSQRVVAHASNLQSVNEALRSVTVVRSQVGIAALLASVDRTYQTDSGAAITAAMLDARRGMSGVRTLMDGAAGDSPLSDAELARQVGVFTTDAETVMGLITARKPTRPGVVALETSFERTRVALTTRRDRLLEAVHAEDQRLWRLGAFASFIVAFVVPACAAAVYTMLTRRPRNEVERELDLARRAAVRARRLSAVQGAVQELRAAVAADRPSTDPAALVEDLAALIAALEGSAARDFGDVQVAAVVDAVAQATIGEGVVVTTRHHDERVWSDATALRHILGNLVGEARNRGARKLELITTTSRGAVQIAVVHDGAPLPAPQARVLHGGAWDDQDMDRRLTTAMMLAESIGARLGAFSTPRPALLVSVPPVATHAHLTDGAA